MGVIRRRRIGIRFRSGRAVIAVAVMHEEVHERTGEKDEERQHAEQMRAMFRKKVEERDGKKSPEHALRDDASASVIDRWHILIPRPILDGNSFRPPPLSTSTRSFAREFRYFTASQFGVRSKV